jgi:hypothetical protein
MAFTAGELENIANSTLEYYYKRPEVRAQDIQDRPLLKKMRAKSKTFPGGKDNISVGVKGAPTAVLEGFSHNDTVSYSNQANNKRATYPWKLLHAGLEFTMHELVKDGISVTDSTTGKSTSNHSERELTRVANLFGEKLLDFMDSFDRDMNTMYWRDGTQDAALVPGITSFILDDPTTATVVGGIDQSTNTWWRNRASLSLNAGTPANQVLVNTLQTEWRQLRRYGGRPDTVLAGSDFVEALEKELRALGNYTDRGWNQRDRTDAGMADISFKGVDIVYDPTLDDLSKAKYCYVMDSRRIHPMVVEGENMKKHNPARPENKYVFYRALTCVEGLVCSQRNAHGVYSIA